MDDLDETILKLKFERKKQENSNIETGVYIKDIFTEFTPVEVLKKFTVLLPSDFVTMPASIAKIKYPAQQRPQCIKTNLETSTNFAISLFDFKMNEKHLDKEAQSLKQVLKKTNPSMEFYEQGIEQLEDFNVAWFDYKSFAVDTQIYNIMFVGVAEGKMLHGVFNCMFKDIEHWKKPALQMIKSICIIKS